MTTIESLAQDIRAQYDIDMDAARDIVQVHVDMIRDDADLWSEDAATLTPAGVEVVTEAVAIAYRKELHGTVAASLLDEIGNAAAEIRATESKLADLIQERDEAIRKALRTELRRADIAAAAGLKEARLYQIRDGRR